MEVFADFLRKNPNKKNLFSIAFYGPDDPYLNSMIQRYRLGYCVKLNPFISFKECIQVQRQADVLLFLDWLEKDVEGILTGKLFEYLTSGRPIICVGNRKNTEAAQIIEKCKCGVTLSSQQGMMKFLENITRHLPAIKPNDQQIRYFSRDHQADILMKNILKRIT